MRKSYIFDLKLQIHFDEKFKIFCQIGFKILNLQLFFQSLLLNGDESNVRGIESCKEVSAEVHVQVHGGNNRVHDDEEDEESPPEIQIYRTSTTSDDNDDDAEAPPRVVVTTAVSGSPPAPQGTKLLV